MDARKITRVLTVVGARPQFIKATALSRAFADEPTISETLVHTGQHFDDNMSSVFFDELGLPHPKYNLGVSGGPHGQMTGRQLEKLEHVILTEEPDIVVVYGDTNSTLAGALAAAKLHVPVAHVEAGLRSFDRNMPEETNRVLTDHVSSWLFAPSAVSVQNLRHEGITDGVHNVGDVMFDVALHYVDKARPPHELTGYQPTDYVLCTIHRPQNTDDPARLKSIIEGLAASGRAIIWPTHPRLVQRLELSALPANIKTIQPVGYLEMTWLLANCSMVATDSGGLQKEAFFHGRPCVTLRNETEWVELVETGFQRLVGSDKAEIARSLQGFNLPLAPLAPYGDGTSATQITAILASASS